jgi:hypothetical protein
VKKGKYGRDFWEVQMIQLVFSSGINLQCFLKLTDGQAGLEYARLLYLNLELYGLHDKLASMTSDNTSSMDIAATFQ